MIVFLAHILVYVKFSKEQMKYIKIIFNIVSSNESFVKKRQCGFVVYKVDYLVMHCLKMCVGSYCKKIKAVLHQGFFYCKNYSINLLDPRFFRRRGGLWNVLILVFPIGSKRRLSNVPLCSPNFSQ